MTERFKRCVHCAEVYAYQASGHGCDRRDNNSQYCPDCMRVIHEALSHVPVRKKKVSAPVTEPSFETVLQWSEEDLKKLEARRDAGEMVFFRIFPGLIDMKDPSNHHIQRMVSGRGAWAGQEFFLSYWTKRGERSVTTTMELDTETGSMRPWRHV